MPRLDDPGEFELIRRIYFEDHSPKSIDIDEEERWDRMQRKRNKNYAR